MSSKAKNINLDLYLKADAGGNLFYADLRWKVTVKIDEEELVDNKDEKQRTAPPLHWFNYQSDKKSIGTFEVKETYKVPICVDVKLSIAKSRSRVIDIFKSQSSDMYQLITVENVKGTPSGVTNVSVPKIFLSTHLNTSGQLDLPDETEYNYLMLVLQQIHGIPITYKQSDLINLAKLADCLTFNVMLHEIDCHVSKHTRKEKLIADKWLERAKEFGLCRITECGKIPQVQPTNGHESEDCETPNKYESDESDESEDGEESDD
ncbi:hypothetical protein L596_017331 [Steinernema carpocapsae]|uniref:Uncharacterized protein n=1 Tax=Steinernema carpocapsae TaxID=34508 RepID=A0A4U5N230_STECR|nr:hypothetical protein L596_017331 [Steinernema carpocapsae]